MRNVPVYLSAFFIWMPRGVSEETFLGRRTPLYDLHVSLGARMVDFGGWDMPVNYGSQIEEHHAVRRDAGIFDVSHMCVIDAKAPRVREFFGKLIANDVAKLKQPGKALYSCMLNEAGGVIDDLIVYFLDESFFRVVVNAGTRDKDLAWMRGHAAGFGVELTERSDLAMLAVQGPNARMKVASLLDSHRDEALALEPFFGRQLGDWFLARTGYTGEDGFEIMVPAGEAADIWTELNRLGVKSAGLGARDTLRLEAAMNLYGNDMDEGQNPLESGLAWTVSFENPARDFVGRKALEALKAAGLKRKFVALLLEDRGVLRGHQKVIADGVGEGEITSGTFSPTLEKSIALARVPQGAGDRVQVDVRGKLLNARVVKAPFVRHGKVLVS
jgi:aminomethyltransferase